MQGGRGWRTVPARAQHDRPRADGAAVGDPIPPSTHRGPHDVRWRFLSQLCSWCHRVAAAKKAASGSACAETDDDVHSVSSRSQWQPDAADVEMMHSLSVVEALPVSRMAVSMAASLRNNRRSIKRMKVVDLGAGPFSSESPFGNDGRPSLPPPGAFAGAGAALGPDAHGGFQASGAPHLGLPSSSFGDRAAAYAVSGRPASLAAWARQRRRRQRRWRQRRRCEPERGRREAAASSMFTDIALVAPTDEHTGSALLCFLSQDTFVGFVELEDHASSERHVLKLTGSESLTECDRALCAVQDCCGDKAFLVTAQTCSSSTEPRELPWPPRAEKRTFLARSSGVGDYVAFEGRGIRFATDFVPGDEQRDQVLRRHFGMLPRSARRDSVLCLGQMTIYWKALGGGGPETGESLAAIEAAESAQQKVTAAAREEHEGYAGDKSDCESSGDERELQSSMRSILPMLAGVAMPTPKPVTYDDLVARGGDTGRWRHRGGDGLDLMSVGRATGDDALRRQFNSPVDRRQRV